MFTWNLEKFWFNNQEDSSRSVSSLTGNQDALASYSSRSLPCAMAVQLDTSSHPPQQFRSGARAWNDLPPRPPPPEAETSESKARREREDLEQQTRVPRRQRVAPGEAPGEGTVKRRRRRATVTN
eukprot:Skav236211  [mRNA]  locus=scaffold98:160336:161857:- [translate_table: standard]